MAAPVVTSNPNAGAQKYHTVQPPPQDSHDVLDVAVVLAAGGTISAMVAALLPIVGRSKISETALRAALGLSGRGTKPKPNSRLAANGAPAGGTTRSVTRQEIYYRAAYLLSAARRIQDDLNEGKPIRTALADESLNYRRHESARKGRLNSAAKVQRAAALHGDLLGWYINPMLNNELECLRANGNNFHASEGTVIGLPGSVHPNCGCVAGPPHEGGGMVNDAVASILRKPNGQRLKLKLVKSA